MSHRSFATIAAAALLASCADSSQPAAYQPGPVARFEIVSGNHQIGIPGDPLPEPLTVRAVDAGGHPVPGRQIAYKVLAGGGSMYVGGGVTNASGIVKDYWTLGTVAGAAQEVEARTVDPESGSRQVLGTFVAQASTEAPNGGAPPARLVTYPDYYPPQKGLVGRVQPTAFRVIAADRYGNLIRRAGITVHWTASGNGRPNLGETVTDSTGVTGARWWFGTVPGPQTLTAALGGSTQSVSFAGVAGPGPVVTWSVQPDSVYFTAFGDTVRFSAVAKDVYGNPWPITYSIPSNHVVAATGTPPRLTAVGNGALDIIVSAGSQADTVPVRVQQQVDHIFYRSTWPATMVVDGYIQLNSYVVARDRTEHTIAGATFTFALSDPTMGVIRSDGLFRAKKSGTVQILTTSGGVTTPSPVITIN